MSEEHDHLMREAIVWARVLLKECQKELNQIPNNHNRAAAQLNTVLNGVLYRNLEGGI